MVEQPEYGTNTCYLVDFIKITLLPKLLNFNEIRSLYLDRGFSAAQIAREYEVAKSVIVGLLNRGGIRPGRQNSRTNNPDNYRLRVPPHVPAQQFWAVTVYDQAEANLMRESPKVEVNSYQNLQKNPDGSVDVYFGPAAPSGQETNWIYTAPGRHGSPCSASTARRSPSSTRAGNFRTSRR